MLAAFTIELLGTFHNHCDTEALMDMGAEALALKSGINQFELRKESIGIKVHGVQVPCMDCRSQCSKVVC